MNTTDAMRLIDAGDELARKLRELRDEFGPGEDDPTEDVGWLSVDVALSAWSRTKVAVTA